MLICRGRFCASDRTVHAVTPGAPNWPGAPGGVTMTGKASFSGIALATISLRPTLDADCAGVGIACIIAAWSCAAWIAPPADEGAERQRGVVGKEGGSTCRSRWS